MLASQPRMPTPRSTSRTLRREGVGASRSSGISSPPAQELFLAERPHVGHQAVDLLRGQLVAIGIHALGLSLALEAVENGGLHLRVADLLLEGRRGHVGDL